MVSLPHGHAVIINNRYFISKHQNRDGAEHDTKNLQLLFEKLCFTVIVREDLSAQVFYFWLGVSEVQSVHWPACLMGSCEILR